VARGGASRLGIFALGAAIAIAAETVINLTLHVGRPGGPDLPELVAMGIAVAMSAAVALVVRGAGLGPQRLVNLGSAYVVALTLLVSFGDHLEGWWIGGHSLHGISWACLLIAVFPFVAPGSIRRNAVVAALLLLTDPLGLALAAQVAELPAPGSGAFADVVVPNLIAVFLAVGMSTFIDRLRRDVRKARQLGQYTLQDKIGEGGMGVVFRAKHAMLRRDTALKLLRPESVGEQALRRFEQEVQSTARLTHPNTVQIFDYGHTPDGVFYYAMEYLDGIDLEHLVERHGALPPGRVIHLLRQVCGALDEAHRAGLVHRDIKPANLMVCERGGVPDVAKVLDFGLVKELPAGRDGGDRPREGSASIVGTPSYLAPEAIYDPDGVDARSDIYALGAVGYFLLTGTPVFDRDEIQALYEDHRSAVPEPPSERFGRPVSSDLEQLLLRCLAKSPDERPADVQRLERRLAACVDASAWSLDDAATWWEQHRARLAPRTDSIVPLPLAQTLAVDWEQRLPG
jgi:serine/threonine-protein kinase